MHPRLLALLSLFAWILSPAQRAPAAEPTVEASELPRIPATAAEKAVSTFKVKPGFRVELVAAEPLVLDPVAMSFDEDGRLYVVEMRDYSERRPERLGQIRRLEDTDGDGRFDRSTIFARDLPWPTAVICYNGGVFVGCTPDIIWMKDVNGDGVADEREVVFTGFAADYAPFATNQLNVQALMNSFNWSLDNRIHGATSFSGGKVKLVDTRFVRRWRERQGVKDSIENRSLELRGRDFSFDPRTLAMRTESGGGQHGLSFDSWGRKFVCANSSHLQLLMYEERYAADRERFQMPKALLDIAVDGGAAPVYRLSPDEPWRVLRTQWRVAGLVPGPVEGGGRPSGYFTGATGVNIYRGDAYGPSFAGDAFVGDAGGNLVHHKRLVPDGASLRGVRPDDEKGVEFLASTDNWFRPVQLANAPDGCLYVCDMYRELIEHPWSLPNSLKKHLDLNSGNDRGRIYRIVPERFKQPNLPQLSRASDADLVRFLAHPNGWTRDTAARLIYQRQTKATKPLLEDLFRTSPSDLARLHTLYALVGLGGISKDLLTLALRDKAAGVRQHAIRLAEPFLGPNDSEEFARVVYQCANDTNTSVLFQLALTLSRISSADRASVSEQLIDNRSADTWTRAAVVANLGEAAPLLFARLLQQPPERTSNRTIADIAREIGASRQKNAIQSTIAKLPDPRTKPSSMIALAALGEGIRGSGGSVSAYVPTNVIDQYFEVAAEFLNRRDKSPRDSRIGERIAAALEIIAFTPYDRASPILLGILTNSTPAEVHPTLSALGQYTGPTVATELLARWASLSKEARGETIDLLLRRSERIPVLLSAMEKRTIDPGTFTPAQQTVLRQHRDASIRDRAAQIFGNPRNGERQAVIDRYLPTLSLKGDPAKGRRIFEARCASCHKLDGIGFSVGPDLKTVRNGGREKLMVNVLDPNREMNANFVSYSLETREGESFLGILTSENATTVSIRLPGGSESVVARTAIQHLDSQSRSLMPEGLEEGLSPAELADLLDFVLSAK